jgi:hypothetical protein
MLTSCQVYKNLLLGDLPILCGHKQAFQGPPRTSQRIAAHQSLTAKKIFLRTPKCHSRRSWARDPEDSKSKPMERAQAPSRWGAQSGCQQRPRQLENVELDSSNKAEAACQVKASSKPTSIPMLGMSLPRLPFLVGTAVLLRRFKFFR